MVLQEYTDLPTMRRYLGQQSTDNDGLLKEAIASASREVDKRCNRYFGKDASTEARKFDVEGNGLLLVDDIADPSSIVVFGYQQFTALPRNGVVDGVPGHPITRLKSCDFREGDVIEIAAVWGWPAVPAVVIEATKMIAAETYMQKDTPLGVSGMKDFGVVRVRERVTIMSKLDLYKRYRIGGL